MAELRNDLTGKIIGDYEVIKFDDTKGKYKYYYWCQCINCNLERSIDYSQLYYNDKGKPLHCKCSPHYNEKKVLGYRKDLSGEIFGDYTVIKYVNKETKDTHSYWLCRCKCGHEDVKSISFLKSKTSIKKCKDCKEKEKIEKLELKKSQLEQIKPAKVIMSGKKKNDYEFKDDIVIINGNIIIDKDDFEKINAYDRYIAINCSGYAYFTFNNQQIFLHRLIAGLPLIYSNEDTLIADHINGDRKDNRKANLRICEKKMNPINCKVYCNNKSGRKGVCWNKKLNKWAASIQADKKTRHLGVFENFEDAVKAREIAEKELFGEFNRQENINV